MKRLALAALAAFVAVPALAQAPCGPREDVAQNLEGRFGEVVVFRGTAPEAIFELWLNEETGTWTVTVTVPSGLACMPASGERGTSVEPETPGEDS